MQSKVYSSGAATPSATYCYDNASASGCTPQANPATQPDPFGNAFGPLLKPETTAPAGDAAKDELLSAFAAEDDEEKEPL